MEDESQGHRSIHYGFLGVDKKGNIDQRYFVLFHDRLDYFSQEENFLKGEKPRGRLVLSDVSQVRASGRGMTVEIHGDSKSLHLRAETEADMLVWVNAIRSAGTSVREEEEAKEYGEVDEVVHRSVLSIVRKGRTDQRYCLLYRDRLVYFNSEESFLESEDPRGRIALCDLTSFSVDDAQNLQLLVDSRNVVLRPMTENDLLIWVDALKGLKVAHTGDLPVVSPVVLTISVDRCSSLLTLRNMGGDEVLSHTYDPCAESSKTLWKLVTDAIGKPKCCISLVKPDGTLIENDGMMVDCLGCLP